MIFDHKTFRYLRIHFASRGLLKKFSAGMMVILTVILLRIFVFGIIQVSSHSMESTLSDGEIVLVDKVKYGCRLPMTPYDIPFLEALAYVVGCQSWSLSTQWKYHRLFEIGIQRNDVVVFKDPRDNRTSLIKRCVGLPGDTISIQHNLRYTNGELESEPSGTRFSFRVTMNKQIANDSLLVCNIDQSSFLWRQGRTFHISITHYDAMALQDCDLVDTVMIDDFLKGSPGPLLFPGPASSYTRENYGPIHVPSLGDTISINTDNIELYRDIISKYEQNELEIVDGGIFINGEKTNRYTCRFDYYFMVGDNRYQSVDSRYWGFVPEYSIIGKAVLVIGEFAGDDNISTKRSATRAVFRQI